MKLEEFERIVEICYTTKVVTAKRNKKQVIIEKNLTPEEIAEMIATEFGFTLTATKIYEEDNE